MPMTATAIDMPTLQESAAHIKQRAKPAVVDVLRDARAAGRVALQPRCGVGEHGAMIEVLKTLEEQARPDVLSVTIDSYTRLKEFSRARRALSTHPAQLNGYPLVAHEWRRGRELDEAVLAPLEVRHGSPDPVKLFEVSIASGFTSFEGGGIGYNLPYAKDVSLTTSLSAWRKVDEACGELATNGVTVDRELFGTLTAVLMPPAVSLAVVVLEAVLAASAGVRCISIAHPQGGNAAQDIAALRCIEALAARYLPPGIEVYPVLHEFMGVFPRDSMRADELIFYGALIARLGRASKLVTKTNQEAHGIPDVAANVRGILTARLAQSHLLEFIECDEAAIEEEAFWIQREVAELVEPALEADDLQDAIVSAFAAGTLDVPFSASRHARSEIIPTRDDRGAIRYLMHGSLPFSRPTLARNRRLVGRTSDPRLSIEGLLRDIRYFAPGEAL